MRDSLRPQQCGPGRKCQERAATDDRMRVKIYEDLNYPTGLVVHAFYFRWLLPIWFDVQSMEWPAGAAPEQRWRYTA